MTKSTHNYSYSQEPDSLNKWACEKVVEVKSYLGDFVPVFCYSSMSGVAHATALVLEYYRRYGDRLHMSYARKEGEEKKCHTRRDVEHTFGNTYDVVPPANVMLVFVDDTVSGGETEKRAVRAACQQAIGTKNNVHNKYVRVTMSYVMEKDLDKDKFLV